MTEYITLTKAYNDLAGQTFGRLTVLGPVKLVPGAVMWLCRCECGNTTTTRGYHLRNGRTQSCGCLRLERAHAANYKHGMRTTPLYKVWAAMKERCSNPASNSYSNYGGRGITVCREWQESFEEFHFYMAQLPHFEEEGYSMDRIENDGNYAPGNMRWATRGEQGRNMRRNHLITYKSETKCASDWAILFNMHPNTLVARIERGWSLEQSFTTPVAPSNRWGRRNVDQLVKLAVWEPLGNGEGRG